MSDGLIILYIGTMLQRPKCLLFPCSKAAIWRISNTFQADSMEGPASFSSNSGSIRKEGGRRRRRAEGFSVSNSPRVREVDCQRTTQWYVCSPLEGRSFSSRDSRVGAEQGAMSISVALRTSVSNLDMIGRTACTGAARGY